MRPSQLAGVASATLGVAGTIFLFVSTFGLQPLEGAPFNGPILQAANTRIKAANRRRLIGQRIGLALLLFGFAGQAWSEILP